MGKVFRSSEPPQRKKRKRKPPGGGAALTLSMFGGSAHKNTGGGGGGGLLLADCNRNKANAGSAGAFHPLKRSRSVRASLRLIGSRFLNEYHNSTKTAPLPPPSSSSPPPSTANHPIRHVNTGTTSVGPETILKTPSFDINSQECLRRRHHHDHHCYNNNHINTPMGFIKMALMKMSSDAKHHPLRPQAMEKQPSTFETDTIHGICAANTPRHDCIVSHGGKVYHHHHHHNGDNKEQQDPNLQTAANNNFILSHYVETKSLQRMDDQHQSNSPQQNRNTCSREVPFDNRSAIIRLSVPSKKRLQSSKTKDNILKLPLLPTTADVINFTKGIADTYKVSSGTVKYIKQQNKELKQKLEKFTEFDIHVRALFAAVESGQLEKVRTILESTDVDVNCLNCDGLSPLDVAVLNNNKRLVKMLISFNARESRKYTNNADKLESHLKALLSETEMRLQEIGIFLDTPQQFNTRASFSSFMGGNAAYQGAAVTGCAGGDIEKQAIVWERRLETLRRLILGFTQSRPPDLPALVAVDVISSSAVSLRLQEPNAPDSAITTKFKVQWSTRADFSVISGEKEVLCSADKTTLCRIDLTCGRRYFFRVACGNLKGIGTYLTSTPSSIIPSTWRDVDAAVNTSQNPYQQKLDHLDELIAQVKVLRPGCNILNSVTPQPQRRTQKKKATIKQLFTAASKFQKNLKRGVYLACVLYHEDKVLLTNEDFLPVIEVDEAFPTGNVCNDLYWLMKVSYNWHDVKSLKSDMEKSASSLVHFRNKLLAAIVQMQSVLGIQDLGQFYYKPLRDENSSAVVLCTTNAIDMPKNVSALNFRWIPLNKLFKKIVMMGGDDQTASDALVFSIQDQINYHQWSSLKLSRGLYVAYLKLQSSMDRIQIVVPAKNPNMLPHCKVRDNSHVTKEEWQYLKQQHLPDLTDHPSEQQRSFLQLVSSAAQRLFSYMDISGKDALNHRLYDTQIIELTRDISLLIVCPSAELSCSAPGQREILLKRADLISLPVSVFEMLHLYTYHPLFVRKYAKLHCLLEMDTTNASHLHREAFSNTELATAKERLDTLQTLQQDLNHIWKTARWLVDVTVFARDKTMFSASSNSGILMGHFLDEEFTTRNTNTLQIPGKLATGKNVTQGRGSWPGPDNVAAAHAQKRNKLVHELSRSEQQLYCSGTDDEDFNVSAYLSQSAAHNVESRKNSDHSCSSDTTARTFGSMAPTNSDETLFDCDGIVGRPMFTVSASSSPLPSVSGYKGASLVSVNTLNSSDSGESSTQVHTVGRHSYTFHTPPPSHCSTPLKQATPSRSFSTVIHDDQDHPKTTVRGSLSKSMSNLHMSSTHPMSPSSLARSSHHFKIPPPPPPPATSSAPCPKSGILQVFAAYETGLASGTSLKLHVTHRSTAREVIDLVVKQLNMAVVLKGKEGPIYSAEKLHNFCLVAVIGARERCLRDDFKPLQLQNPWKKGRLYVRQKHDVLAALEHSSRQSSVI